MVAVDLQKTSKYYEQAYAAQTLEQCITTEPNCYIMCDKCRKNTQILLLFLKSCQKYYSNNLFNWCSTVVLT